MFYKLSHKYKAKIYQDRRCKLILNKKSDTTKTIKIYHNCFHTKNNNKSIIIKFLITKKFFPKTYSKLNKCVLTIPENFTLSQNPDECLKLIKKLCIATQSNYLNTIEIDHSKCKNMDLSASLLLDIILMENAKLHDKYPINISGKMPENPEIRDMLIASGLIKHLDLEYFTHTNGKIKTLELIQGGDSGYVATKVAQYINECLLTKQIGLKKEGLHYLSEIVSEVVDNCYNHSGLKNSWFTIGHYSTKSEQDNGECNIVILNFGQTIYESIQKPKDIKLYSKMKKLSKKHNRFYYPFRWNEESLFTLYSLQEGVSSCRCVDDPDRGTGTIKLINDLQCLGCTSDNNVPLMSIISGRTLIKFNESYKLENVHYKDGSTHLSIAFNKKNSFKYPPDKNNIKVLKSSFPGTIISLKFYIDKNYIKHLMKGDQNEQN